MFKNGARLGFIAEMPRGATIPDEFQVFPFGQIQVQGSEPFTVDSPSMDSVVRQFRERGLDMVIDYEHQTEKDTEAPAAGWIKDLSNRGMLGLWAKVEWTRKAEQYLANREYRYFSPVFFVSKDGRKLVSLLRVALTNAPRMDGIQPIVAKNSDPLEGDMEHLKVIAKKLGLPETATIEQVLAKLDQVQAQGNFLILSAKAVGLAETATGDQVIAKIGTLKDPAQLVVCKEVADALGVAETAGKSEIVASIHALKQRPDATVVQEIAALKAKLAARDAGELVTAALKDGKITPAQKEWAEKYAQDDPEGFKLFVAKAPQVVPVGKAGVVSDKAGQGSLDENQLHINKLLGVSEEDFKKHNPAAA